MNIDFFVDIFFPPVCVSCARRIPRGTLCASCRSTLLVRHAPLAKVLPDAWIGSAGSYDDRVLQTLIHALKFRFIKGAAEPLAEVLCEYAQSFCAISGFIVVPIPLSKRRERTRGWNQSALIGKLFAEYMKLPFAPEALTRIRHKKPQSETNSLAEREENIRGCFSALPIACAGKNIILIDDVTTSGATFLEAIHILRAAGAKKIIALAIARA